MNKPYLYVIYGNLSQIPACKEQHTEYEVIPITDEFTIRARCEGKILYLDGCTERWDYQGIWESIERAKKEWGTDEEEVPEEEQDINYGI